MDIKSVQRKDREGRRILYCVRYVPAQNKQSSSIEILIPELQVLFSSPPLAVRVVCEDTAGVAYSRHCKYLKS